MSKLFDAIYRELNNIANDNSYPRFTQNDACGYYNTICQHRHELDEIAQECERYEFYLHYEQETENEYYDSGDGTISIYFSDWQNSPEYQFKIGLHYTDRHYGYCMCQPTDPGYNVKHRCCGAGCDASFPSFDLVKTKTRHFEFQGFERDLWALEEEWNGSTKEDCEEKNRLEAIKHIEEEIQRLNEARYNLIAEGNKKA